MSLKDLLKRKQSNPNLREVIDNSDGEIKQIRYNQAWLGRVALYQGYIPNDNIGDILKELNANNGLCDIGLHGPDYQCPCSAMREHGLCTRGLFKNLPSRRIGGSSTITAIKRNGEE